VGNSMCPLCLDGEETVQRLFITCKVAQKRVWDACDRWVRIETEMCSVSKGDIPRIWNWIIHWRRSSL